MTFDQNDLDFLDMVATDLFHPHAPVEYPPIPEPMPHPPMSFDFICRGCGQPIPGAKAVCWACGGLPHCYCCGDTTIGLVVLCVACSLRCPPITVPDLL